MQEQAHSLAPDILEVFARKGMTGGCGSVQVGNSNGTVVRRVMQITSDFAKVPFDQLKIIDFGCAEGVFAIEAALRGADVFAFDGRTERMKDGEQIARRLGLSNLRFEQRDA